MKYIVFSVFCFCFTVTKAHSDTLFVDDYKDARYLRYKDSLQAYQIGYSVAKNMADTLASVYGYKSI